MPKRRKLWSIGLGLFVLVPMLLAACGPTATTSTTVKKGGTVTDAISQEPDSMLPNLTQETFGVLVQQAIWAPLWYGDNSGTSHLLPGIASEVPSVANGGISADAKTYTIKLKPNLKWSDGSPLTVDDLVFSLNLYANVKFGGQEGFPLTCDQDGGEVKAVTKVDAQTAKLELCTPDVTINNLLADGTGSILPMKVFSAMKPEDIAKSPEAEKPSVVSGPFTVSDRVTGASITLKANPNYYQAGKPNLDSVVFKIVTDATTILTALQAQQVDTAYFLPVDSFESYKALSGYTVFTDKNPANFEWLVFNLTHPFMSDINVRKAITMAVNTQTEITQIQKGAAVATCDAEPASFGHDTSLIPCYKVDIAGANTLLDTAGYTKGADGYRTKDGKPLEITMSTTAGRKYRENSELIIQDALKQIGIKLDIKNYPARVFFGANAAGILHSGAFDIGEFENTTTYDPDDHTIFASDQTPDKGGSNYMHYSNPAVDAALKTEVSSPDVATRKKAFDIVNKAVLADVPVMFLYSSATICVSNNRVHNYAPSPNGPGETWNIWDWYVS